jgi:Putative lumazine-binding
VIWLSTLQRKITMPKTETGELTDAVQLYLDLMYDCDVGKFDKVFAATSQLHGFREGRMTCWPAAQYKEVLAARKSPRALGAPREEQVLLLDFTSPTQALAKVRVRIHDMVFVDYLSYHKVDGRWLITSKAYHRET